MSTDNNSIHPSRSFRNALKGFCPVCVQGKLMRRWFRVNLSCPHCGHPFPVKEGSFLGAMAINYGLAVFGLLPVWLVLWKLWGASLNSLFWGAVVVATLGPLFLYPISWRIWIGLSTAFFKDEV